MSLLSVVQTACKRLGLPVPTTVISNANTLVTQLLSLLEEGGKEVRDTYYWPQLNRTATITLVDAQSGYNLPSDINFTLARTQWDRTNQWPLVGPLSAEQWQTYKSGIAVPATRRLYRVMGFGPAKFEIYPTPDSGDAGDVLAYEYQSLWWIRATADTAGSKEAYTVDTDVSLLKESILEKELVWRWRRAKRLDFALEQEECMNAWKREVAALAGTKTINMINSASGAGWVPPYPNVPETGFGS